MITTNRSVRQTYAAQRSNPCDDSGAWDRLTAGSDDAGLTNDERRRIRIPFLVTFRGRGNREKTLLATAKEVSGKVFKLLTREPIDAYQSVRIRPDVDGMQTAWVRGVALESIQSVGGFEVLIDCSGRHTG